MLRTGWHIPSGVTAFLIPKSYRTKFKPEKLQSKNNGLHGYYGFIHAIF